MSKPALLLLPLLFASCATITRGVHDKLYVNSEPSGADVILSTGEKSVTPAKFAESRKRDVTVTVSKAGYIAQTVQVQSKFSATGGTAMAGNIVAGGVVGIGIDAVSGATSSLYPNPVNVRLVPAPVPKSLKSTKRTTATSSTRKSTTRKTAGANSAKSKTTKPKPAPETKTEDLPPIQATPAPESPPVLQSAPESSPHH